MYNFKTFTRLTEEVSSDLDKLIKKLSSQLKGSAPKPVAYRSGKGYVPNQKYITSTLEDKQIFNILVKNGFKKGSGYQPKPDEWDHSKNHDEMRSVSDSMFLRTGGKLFSVSVRQEHGSKIEIVFTDTSMNEDLDLLESNSYQIMHKDFTSACTEVLRKVKADGYEFADEDEWFRKVSSGPRKPSEGKTNKYTLELMKNGKNSNKALHFQVYNTGKSYELNVYIN